IIWNEWVEAMLTIAPWPASIIAGRTARVQRQTPSRSTDMHRVQSSSVASSGFRKTLTPALLTRTLGAPNAARAASYIAATDASSVTSVSTKTVSAPRAASLAAMAEPVAGLISATTTRAPSLAKQPAIAAPIPCPAPVTIATLPANRDATSIPCERSYLSKIRTYLIGAVNRRQPSPHGSEVRLTRVWYGFCVDGPA